MVSFFEAHTPVELNKVARLFGTRRTDYVEIDVLLTYLLQRMHETGIMEHLIFKGGTMLRKMVFGPGGRLSTDLDFAVRSVAGITPDDLALGIATAFSDGYMGIRFAFNLDKDLGTTGASCRANPRCVTSFTPSGHVIKIEVSHRADPVLHPVWLPQKEQPYFPSLGFVPANIPCMTLNEAMGEKIRAAFQRPKIRDLHDLRQLRRQAFDPDVVRSLAVLKIWESPEGASFEPFSHDTLAKRMADRVKRRAYDEQDLQGLIRQDQRVDLTSMVEEVRSTYGFLGNMTSDETELASDKYGKKTDLATRVREAIQAAMGPAPHPGP